MTDGVSESTTLQDLVERHKKKKGAESAMLYI
jgi:hypothetical protein